MRRKLPDRRRRSLLAPHRRALWLLSGIYLVLQALVNFGCGGYLAGRSGLSHGGAPMVYTA